MRKEHYNGAGIRGSWLGAASSRGARFFEPGELRLAILSLLEEGPKHGYQLMKAMEERSGGTYRASPGSVYPTLQQLEDEQRVVVARVQGRKVHSLAPEGREEAERSREAIQRIWDRAEDWQDWGQWMGPEAQSVALPLSGILKSTVRALRWAKRHPDREEHIRGMLKRFNEELDQLMRNG